MLAVLIYAALALLALKYRHRTKQRLSTQAEWRTASFLPWSELLIFVALLPMLVADVDLLYWPTPNPGAQLWQIVALVIITGRGLLASWIHRRAFRMFWASSKR